MRTWMIFTLVFALLLALSLGAQAENTTTGLDVLGIKRVNFSVVAATQADVVASDTGTRASKRDQIVRLQAGGQTMYVCFRFEQSANGVFIDGIAAATTTALATAIDGFDLTADVPGHPSPVNDAVDDATSLLMVGYTGS